MASADQPVVIDGFAGPFDLLLRLVERRELNLLTISLAEVAEQYLDRLETAKLRDPEHLSAFLIVAAKLLLIKSILVLPTPPRLAAEDLPADPTDLLERLRIYQQFQKVTAWLVDRDEANLRSYPRPPLPYQPPERPTEPLPPLLLRTALLAALRRPKPPEVQPVSVEARLSVAEVVSTLKALLTSDTRIALSDLVASSPSPQRYVATFLAILEVVRLGVASASQEERFGEIIISRRPAGEESALSGLGNLRDSR